MTTNTLDKFEVTQRGMTTTVTTDTSTFKITYSERQRRFQVKLDGKLQSEGTFQECVDYCDRTTSFKN